jgi:hypothetical protein
LAFYAVRVGRKNENPRPEIIFGGIGVRQNHGQFTMLENGLIQFEITSNVPEAYQETLINGKRLPE